MGGGITEEIDNHLHEWEQKRQEFEKSKVVQ